MKNPIDVEEIEFKFSAEIGKGKHMKKNIEL
jgi:hypothetical protein